MEKSYVLIFWYFSLFILNNALVPEKGIKMTGQVQPLESSSKTNISEGFVCRKATEEDKEQWNNVVINSLNGTFYHTWEWKEVIEKGLNSEAIPIVVEDDKEKKIIGIFPFFLRSCFEYNEIIRKFPCILNNFQIGCSPYYKVYSFGGPCVLVNIADSNKIYNLMFGFVDNYSRKKKSISSHMIYPYHDCLDTVLIQNGYITVRSRETTVININKNLDEICNGFKKQFSKDIKRAIRSEVNVYESQNCIKDIDLFFDQFQKALIDRILEQNNNDYKKISGALLPYSYFEKMRDILFPEKMAKLFFVEYKGIKIGAQINFYYKDTVYLGITSVLRGYNNLNASKLLIWHSIVDGKRNNFRYMDLAGLHPNKSHGQYKFKMGFNGQIRENKEYTKSYRYKEIKHAKKLLASFIGIHKPIS